MIRLSFTRDRLFDLTLDHASGDRSAAKPPARSDGRRLASRAKALFDATLQIIAAAKLRRIERELRIRGPQHDWLQMDDDHFTPIEH